MTLNFTRANSYLLTFGVGDRGAPGQDVRHDFGFRPGLHPAKDPMARVACETSVTTGLVVVMGEITTNCYVEIPQIVRETVWEIGYTRAKYGLRWRNLRASSPPSRSNLQT